MFLAGKTVITNNNFDAWFIGFHQNCIIGVYIGFDNPRTLENRNISSVFVSALKFYRKCIFKEDLRFSNT